MSLCCKSIGADMIEPQCISVSADKAGGKIK